MDRIRLKNIRWMTARLLNVRGDRGVYEHSTHHGELKVENGVFVSEFSQNHDVVEINGNNSLCLPGAIDTQVHFREPGLTHKETIESGSRSALRGGTTSFFEMPNTQPPTDSITALAQKIEIARNTSWADFAFYAGATPQNSLALSELENYPGCCGIKVFMGSSTGTLLVDKIEVLRTVLSQTKRRVALHCEDEERLNERKKIILANTANESTEQKDVHLHPIWRDEETAYRATHKALILARELNRKIHILHVSTQQEIELLKLYEDVATFEILPQHVHFESSTCYSHYGTLAQMNPPIRSKHHQLALLNAMSRGRATVMGSDHAPHTLEEKNKPYPQSPSGITGAQYFYRAALDLALRGSMTLGRALELTSLEPSRLFGIQKKGQIKEGYDADFILFNDMAEFKVSAEPAESQSPFTLWHSQTLKGNIEKIFKAGELVFSQEDELFKKPRVVSLLKFEGM